MRVTLRRSLSILLAAVEKMPLSSYGRHPNQAGPSGLLYKALEC